MDTNKEVAAGRAELLRKKVTEVREIVERFNAEVEAGNIHSTLGQAQMEAIAERGRAYLSELKELEELLKG